MVAEEVISPASNDPGTASALHLECADGNVKQRGCVERTGRPGAAVLFIGFVVILLATGLLVTLWTGHDTKPIDDAQPTLWERVVFAGWAPGLVTLCSAAIRTSMGL